MIRSGGVGTKLVLCGLALVSLTRGLAYSPWTDHPYVTTLTYLERFAPLWVYALVWFASTLIIAIAVYNDRFRPTAISVFMAISCLWAFSYFSSWVWLDQTRAWVTGSYYIALGFVALGVGLRFPKPRGV